MGNDNPERRSPRRADGKAAAPAFEIGYARVSTLDQTLDLQLDALKEAGCQRIYQDEASGKTAARPQLRACLDALRRGDTLCVWRLDRLGRSLGDLIEIISILSDQGIEFESLTEGIDTRTATGKLVFHLAGAFAEFERNIIRERTLAGLKAARARGRNGGRPKKLNDKKLEAARAMLRSSDLTYRDVARQLGVSTSTLYRNVGVVPQQKRV